MTANQPGALYYFPLEPNREIRIGDWGAPWPNHRSLPLGFSKYPKRPRIPLLPFFGPTLKNRFSSFGRSHHATHGLRTKYPEHDSSIGASTSIGCLLYTS